MFNVKCIVLASLAISALASPHQPRISHREVAARLAVPVQAEAELPQIPVEVSAPRVSRKRSLSKRCKPKSPSASVSVSIPVEIASTSSSTSATSTKTTAKPTTTASPTTTSTKAKTTATKTTSAAKASSTSSGSTPSFMSGTQTGQGTFYGTGLGSCGITSNDSQDIVAVSHLLYDTFPGYVLGNPNNNPVCNQKIKATYQGKSVTVTVVDRCTGCALTDLDFSPHAFNTIADPAIGRISGMTWEWV